MNGVINIYKEKGYTSFHVVYIIRKLTGEQKVGHTGTLDPDVTGVLPVCIGKATKLVGRLTDTDKTYRCTMAFGMRTDTQDVSGKILESIPAEDVREKIISLADNTDPERFISETIRSFTGETEQIPPMFSALKIDGMKLVNAARKGVEVERHPRKVIIYSIEDIEVEDSLLTAGFTVCCSKGTYVRTLCEDIGKKLGIPACMASLERTKAAGLDISTAVTLEEAERAGTEGKLEDLIIPADRFLYEYPSVTVTDDAVRRLIYGNYMFRKDMDPDEYDAIKPFDNDGCIYRVYDRKGQFYALYKADKKAGCIKCVKMFF